MRKFTTRLSTLLYVLLIAILGFVTLIVTTVIVVVIGDAISPGIFGAVHVRPGAVDLSVPGMAPAMVALLLFAMAMVTGALLPLIGMLRSTAAGDPFVAANVRRLHIIAGVIAIALVAQLVLPHLLPAQLVGMVEPMDGGSALFALLLTLVLAEVFREGVRLREDVEGTI